MLGVLVVKGLYPIEIYKHTKHISFVEKTWKITVEQPGNCLQLVCKKIKSDLGVQYKKRRKVVRQKLTLLKEDYDTHGRDINNANLEVVVYSCLFVILLHVHSFVTPTTRQKPVKNTSKLPFIYAKCARGKYKPSKVNRSGTFNTPRKSTAKR
jgi:hypothetical protein